MTTSTTAAHLRAIGFTDADQRELSDRPILNLVYLRRVHGGQYQYVSLCAAPHDADQLVEAVVEVYLKPKAKTRAENLCPRLCRTTEDLLDAVGRVYSPPKPY